MTKAYGTPINPAVHTGPAAHRNRVGEADYATRRRMLDQRLSEREPVKPAAPRPAAPGGADEQKGVSPNAYRLLRDRGKQIDKDVSDLDK